MGRGIVLEREKKKGRSHRKEGTGDQTMEEREGEEGRRGEREALPRAGVDSWALAGREMLGQQ